MVQQALMQTLRAIFAIGPLIFGVGFLAPLVAQTLLRTGWSAPFGLTPLVFGLIVGGGLGLLAQLRGRWL